MRRYCHTHRQPNAFSQDGTRSRGYAGRGRSDALTESRLAGASRQLWKTDSWARSGFTLIELLVAIGIFLLLSTISLSALNSVTGGGGDRVPAGVRTLQAALENARQKAAALGRPVGLRAVVENTPESAFGHLVREFEYVAEVEPAAAGALDPRVGWLAFIEEVTLSDGATVPTILRRWRVAQLTTPPSTATAMNAAGASVSAVPWSLIDGGDLDGDGVADEPALVRPGGRIWIGDESNGAYYTIAPDDPLTENYSEFGPDQNELGTAGNEDSDGDDPPKFILPGFQETAGVDPNFGNYLTLVEDYRNTRPVSRMQDVRFNPRFGGLSLHDSGPLRGYPSASGIAFYESLLDNGSNVFDVPTPSNFGVILPANVPPPAGMFPPVGPVPNPELRRAATRTFFVPYRLEGGLEPLADAPRVRIENGVWVDVDASTPAQLQTPSDAGGDGSGLNDPHAPFEIVFRPDGSIGGDLGRYARVYLYLADEQTLSLLPSLVATPDAAWAGPMNVHPRTSAAAYDNWARDGNAGTPAEQARLRIAPLDRAGFVPAITPGDHRLISITTRSGLIESGQVFPDDTNTVNALGADVSATPDGWADNPELFVVNGEAVE